MVKNMGCFSPEIELNGYFRPRLIKVWRLLMFERGEIAEFFLRILYANTVFGLNYEKNHSY